MSLSDTLTKDMKISLKTGDALRLSTIRMLLTALRAAELKAGTGALDEAAQFQVVQREIKQRRDSIEQFMKGGRPELAAKEEKEQAILQEYLPKQLSSDELAAIVKETIKEAGAVSKKEAGKVMKAVMGKVHGRSDGQTVNRVVLGLLP